MLRTFFSLGIWVGAQFFRVVTSHSTEQLTLPRHSFTFYSTLEKREKATAAVAWSHIEWKFSSSYSFPFSIKGARLKFIWSDKNENFKLNTNLPDFCPYILKLINQQTFYLFEFFEKVFIPLNFATLLFAYYCCCNARFVHSSLPDDYFFSWLLNCIEHESFASGWFFWVVITGAVWWWWVAWEIAFECGMEKRQKWTVSGVRGMNRTEKARGMTMGKNECV